MKLLYFLCFIPFFTIFASCSYTRIGYSTAAYFQKDDSLIRIKRELDSLNQSSEAETIFKLKSDTSIKYNVLIYRRVISDLVKSYFYFFDYREYDMFAFAFYDNKLIYCGNFDDFKTNDNEQIKELGEMISDFWINK